MRRVVAADGGLRYSRELIELIRADYDFAVGAACFPEVHMRARRPRRTCATSTRRSTPARASSSPSCSSTTVYYDFVARARDVGIEVPIVPGIMPITNSDQIQPLHADVRRHDPDALLRELELRADDPEAVAEFGVAYATVQCADLLPRRARHPLLHAQPLAFDARDPLRPALPRALAAGRGGLTAPAS